MCLLWTETKSRSIKTQKKRTRSTSSYLDRTSLGNKGFLTWHSTPSCYFMFLLLWLPVSTSFCSLLSFSLTLLVFAFSSSIRIEKSRKIFLLSRKIFLENFRAPIWTSAKFYCGNKTGNPERKVSPHLTHFGSQSQRGIWFILSAHGASHMIDVQILLSFLEILQHFLSLSSSKQMHK